nr:hypothetical protein B0A51_08593 [Rachicladosporium sp. CCFEE 5018]
MASLGGVACWPGMNQNGLRVRREPDSLPPSLPRAATVMISTGHPIGPTSMDAQLVASGIFRNNMAPGRSNLDDTDPTSQHRHIVTMPSMIGGSMLMASSRALGLEPITINRGPGPTVIAASGHTTADAPVPAITPAPKNTVDHVTGSQDHGATQHDND